MTITNPTLVLTFLGGDLSAGHSTSQTITNAFIINRSISFSYQLLDGLKSSSNQVSLQISRASASVEDIIATDGDIKAVLKDGTTTLFTGYISTSFTWAVTDSGEQALKIALEDVSTRLFSKPFITSGYHLFNTNAQTAINVICASAGVTVSSSAVTVPGTVTNVVDSSLSCRDILVQMLYELGYVYYCDNLGELRFFEINCDSVSGLPVLDNTKLYTNGNQVVSLSKKIRQYRSVRMSFKTIGTASDYLVYRNTTGQDDTHPYCNLELEAGEHFDGLEVYTAQEWQAETADTFREDALVEACNAASETKIVGSNKIISVSNLSVISEKGSNISASITAMGGQYLKIDAENSGNSTQAITRLDAYGTILYENTTEIIRTGISGNTTDSLFSEELSYIHTRALAVKHANLVNQFQAYSNSLYTFYSKEDLDCGALVNLNENQFSGLKVNVLIINKAVSSSTDIIKYSAVGISVFDLDKDVYHRSTDTAKSDTKGASAEVQYALGDSLTEPPVEEMRWNGEPMAWGGDQMFWETADFTNEVPTLVDGYYIWMRVRVGNGEWQYSRLTGEQGEDGSDGTPAYVWNFLVNYETYKRNLRLSSATQTITLIKDIQGYTTSGSWTCDNGTITDYDSTTAYLTIPYSNDYDTVTITLSDGTNAVSKTISVIDETLDANGMYLGTLDAIPTNPVEGDVFISGDYFIANSSFTGTDSESYTIGIPYYYEEDSWHNVLSVSDANNAQKVMNCISGIANSAITVPVTSAFYGWFQNFVAQNAVIKKLFSYDIESVNYTEDTDTSSSTYGSPLSGYILEYEGGEDAKGQIKSYGGVFNDMTVRGSLNMYARDGVNEGANILHPALTTVAGSAGDTSGGATVSAINNSWNSSALYNHSGITANSILSASGKIDLTTSITQCLRMTDTSTVYISAGSTETLSLINSGALYTTISKPQDAYAQSIRIRAYDPTSINGILIKVGETTVFSGTLKSSGETISVPAGSSIQIRYYYYWSDSAPSRARIRYQWQSVSFGDAGFSQGFHIYYSGAWHNLGTSSTISNPLYLTSPASFYDSGHYQIPTNFLNYSGGTVSMTEGVPYRITSSNLLYNTTSIIGKFFTKNGDGSRNLIYTDSNGENQASITLSSSTYVYMSGTIVVSATEAGVEMKGQYPVAHNTYDIGTSSKVWKTGYFMDVIANGNSLTSAREKKENIVDYTDSALSLIDQTKIVNFSYKEDANHVKHIGFIADDTPKELSGEKQNMMVVGDCIGVLIKAVQELKAEIDILKNK